MRIIEDLHSILISLTSGCAADQVVVVSDRAIPVSWSWPTLVLSGGEAEKNLATVQHIWDFLFDHAMTRRGLLLCIGGGVVTDLGGFAASTYLRGIDYINVPTTLLAMIDASSGGKTGCNYRGVKNSIGAFYPPVETLVYPGWLCSLPGREWLSGYAELLKTGLIDNSTRLWERALAYDLDQPDTTAITPLIADCIAAKDRIVASDPHEKGLRKALNLGHTFGHALEELSANGERMLHGYAVFYGLIAEMYLSVTLLGCPREPLQQLSTLMHRYYGQPVCRCSNREQLIRWMYRDKKNEHTAEINCTLVSDVGSPVVNQTITEAQALEAWEYLFSL